jgi:hypothetical protein
VDVSACFQLPAPIKVPSGQLYRLILEPVGRQLPDLEYASGAVRFIEPGWFEVLLSVGWDATNDAGHRFAHTSLPDRYPLHSEAIEAQVLNALSGGEQLLRGNTVFAPGGVDHIALEVWQDSGGLVSVHQASLLVRRLVPAS